MPPHSRRHDLSGNCGCPNSNSPSPVSPRILSATPNDRLKAKVLLLLNGITYISSGSDTGSHPLMLRFRWQSLFFNKPLFP